MKTARADRSLTWRKNLLVLASFFNCIVLFEASSFANTVDLLVLDEPETERILINIVDQDSVDLDTKKDHIKYNFDVTITNKFKARGTLLAFTQPGVSASTILTDVTIDNINQNIRIDGAITAHHFFPGIGPTSTNSASLAGQYIRMPPLGGLIGYANIVFRPYYYAAGGRRIGLDIIDTLFAINFPPPALFNGSSGPLVEYDNPVEGHLALLPFGLGSLGDAINLPNSAEIHTVAIPPIPTLVTWGYLALALFLACTGLVMCKRHALPSVPGG